MCMIAPIILCCNKCLESKCSVSLVPDKICCINRSTSHIHRQLTRFLQCLPILQEEGKNQAQY